MQGVFLFLEVSCEFALFFIGEINRTTRNQIEINRSDEFIRNGLLLIFPNERETGFVLFIRMSEMKFTDFFLILFIFFVKLILHLQDPMLSIIRLCSMLFELFKVNQYQ